MTYILLVIGAVLVNNVVLTQFLGICPFLGVSKRLETSFGMSAAVLFVMTLATLVTSLLQAVLEVLQVTFLQTITFILVIAALVQMVEIVMKKIAPPLYQALGIFLPLITTNCAVLGIAILSTQRFDNVAESVVFAAATALGFGLALVLFAGIREQLDLYDLPRPMRGAPIALITAGLLSLAFMGFSGLVR